MTSLPPVVPLTPDHDRSAFDSGEPALDRWLREQAGQSGRKDGTRTYVANDGGRVAGYYSLCAYSVEWDQAPPPTRIGRHDLPAVLVARLAVDRAWQGRGLGSLLLLDALVRVVRVADQLGVRLVVVHALHERAAGFYLARDFLRFDADPLTLYLPLPAVRRTLAEAGLR